MYFDRRTERVNTQKRTTDSADTTEPTICLKSDGTPRTIYTGSSEARVAVFLAKQYGKDLFAYSCRLCNCIHVRPIGSIAPPNPCAHCNKMGYETEEDAQKIAGDRYKKAGVLLVGYRCPYSDEYHLTKA